MVEKAVILSGERPFLCPEDFPLPQSERRPIPFSYSASAVPVPDSGIDFDRTMSLLERNIIDQALQKARGNKTHAADLLRMKRTTFISKLRVLEMAC
jgi:DNA-binding NtrC family response regulator